MAGDDDVDASAIAGHALRARAVRAQVTAPRVAPGPIVSSPALALPDCACSGRLLAAAIPRDVTNAAPPLDRPTEPRGAQDGEDAGMACPAVRSRRPPRRPRPRSSRYALADPAMDVAATPPGTAS